MYLNQQSRVKLGFAYKYSDVKLRDSSFVQTTQPFGVEVSSLFEISTELQYDSRDHQRVPTSGFYGRLATSYYPIFLDNEDHFAQLWAESRAYFGNQDVTLALRATGERVWGKFPFYEAAFLGGSESLRGFRFQRFAGDAAVLGSAELRFFLLRFRFLVPHDFGLFGFAESGRVWLDGESEGSWHKDFGGGLWIAPVRRDFAFSIGAGVSNERTALVAGLGFGF
jgi:outer membrane protein assembly factor BamA